MGGRTAVPAAVAAWIGLLCGAAAQDPGAGAPAAARAAAAWLAAGAALAARRSARDARGGSGAGWARLGATALALAALAAAGAARGTAHRAALVAARERVDESSLHRLLARVVEPPRRESGEPLAVVSVLAAAPPLPAGTRLRLRLPDTSPAEWGDRLEALARLDRPRPRANPGGWDALASADAAALAATGRALDARAARDRGPGAWPRATAARWRRALERRFARHLDPDTRALVAPLVTGDRTALGPELAADLRAGGLVHLLALSGLHVAWLAAAARAACAAAGAGPRARAVAGALAALAYVGIAGPLPSLLRAAATESLAALAALARRPLDPVQALAVSALALTAAAPGFAGDFGFQLSCAATLGLVTLSAPLGRALPGPRGPAGLLAATLAAQAAAWPLLAARVHALSWTGPLANLVAVPVCGLLLAAVWIGALADAVAPGLGRPWLAACEPLAHALRAVAGAAGRAPGALLPLGHEPAAPWLAGAGVALLVAGWAGPRAAHDAARAPGRARAAARWLGATLAATALGIAATAPPRVPAPGRWWMVTLDVGQGDAVALGLPDGWWLVDAGPRTPHHDAGEAVVLPFLRWAGVRRLEALVLTHDDGDHTGGAEAVGRGAPPRRRLAPPPLARIAGPARRFGASAAARGDTLRRAPHVVVLWPPPAGAPGADSLEHDNRASLVLLAGEGAALALLAADVDSAIEVRLAAPRGVAALKVAHHGAASSSGGAWLAALRPARAVVSCARRSAFGHPDPGALGRLAAAGARIHRTDREGAVWLEFDGHGARRLDWRARPPRGSAAARGSPGLPPRPSP